MPLDTETVHPIYGQFSKDINLIFNGNLKAMYAFGSAVYGDLHPGFSDLDFFAVVSCAITQEHFDALLEYRKKLKAMDNRLFGILEGEFVPENLLAVRKGANVAYWGTKGERIKPGYDLSGFSMRSLMEDGVLVFGNDIRCAIPHPTQDKMLAQVRSLVIALRKYAVTTTEDVHSADWLFLICQSLYWLKTGNITYKTKAAEWAKSCLHESWCGELDRAKSIRQLPESALLIENRRWLAGLGATVQAACDSLEKELDRFPTA